MTEKCIEVTPTPLRPILRKVPVWISTKESLPDINKSVIIYSEKGYISEGVYLGNKWVQYRWSCELKPDEVSYWMPLDDLSIVRQASGFFNAPHMIIIDQEGEKNGSYD